jgi:hypothetical protein
VIDELLAADDALPRARRKKLVVRPMRDAVLVYERDTHHVHSLDAHAAAVWELCDGERNLSAVTAALAARPGTAVDREMIAEVVGQLAAAGLLEGEPRRRRGRVPRRTMLRWVGAAALPFVATVLAPTPAQAAVCSRPTGRPNGCPCSAPSNCASGNCNSCPQGQVCCQGSGCGAGACG